MNRRDAILAALRVLAPAAPPGDLALAADHAVGAPGLKKATPQAAAWLSLVAFIRHSYTDYDDLLADGYEVDAARHFCRDRIDRVLQVWGCRLRVAEGPADDG
jgi:hypothetical protein